MSDAALRIDYSANDADKKIELRILKYLQQMLPKGLLEDVLPVTRIGKKCREVVALEFKNELEARVFKSKVANATPYNTFNEVVLICQTATIIQLCKTDSNSKKKWKEDFQKEYQEECKKESAEEQAQEQKGNKMR
ncbi:MAG: hypothetical protein M1561_06590 [Gammaproteobacteria bacterium]|nr:hypothetical protein [Gammaproteobacteria bacterium]